MKLWIVSISLVFSPQTGTSLVKAVTLSKLLLHCSPSTQRLRTVCLPAAEIPPSLDPSKIQIDFLFLLFWNAYLKLRNAYLKLCCIFRQLWNLLLQPVDVRAIPNNLNKTQCLGTAEWIDSFSLKKSGKNDISTPKLLPTLKQYQHLCTHIACVCPTKTASAPFPTQSTSKRKNPSKCDL